MGLVQYFKWNWNLLLRPRIQRMCDKRQAKKKGSMWGFRKGKETKEVRTDGATRTVTTEDATSSKADKGTQESSKKQVTVVQSDSDAQAAESRKKGVKFAKSEAELKPANGETKEVKVVKSEPALKSQKA